LDFVDVDIVGDVRVFVDPRALHLLDTEWGAECRHLLQNFFHNVLDAIRDGREAYARQLLAVLREPNETHLGLSRGRAQGRGLGSQSALDVADSLAESEAAKTGLLEDLEDAVLMVEGIADDIVSDIATNVIREPLIRYTQAMCALYGIPVALVASGPMWNPKNQVWHTDFVEQPVANGRRLLLIPKAIVREKMDYDVGEYYRDFLLEHLKGVELSANTALVKILKDGRRTVYIKDLKAKYGTGKRAVVTLTRQYPEVIERYRAIKRSRVRPPLDHTGITEAIGGEMPDWDQLLAAVLGLPSGPAHATEYHRAIEKLLSALFSNDLAYPEVEYPIHEGRKRIDIKYTNVATRGFFQWVGDFAPAPHVFVECKNYSRDAANPELDQLAGRFSSRRGKFGILICRHLEDKDLFLQRCRDTAVDDRGFIVALDDEDITALVADARRTDIDPVAFPLLRRAYDRLLT